MSPIAPDERDSERVVFNGKFLSAKPTGVHRVAIEIINALSDLGERPRIAAPKNQQAAKEICAAEITVTGGLQGQLWEQLSLPAFAGRRTTVNLCNLSPIVSPGVVMIHDAQVHLSPQSYSRAFSAYYRLVQPLMGHRAKRVLTVSEYSRQQLARFGVAPLEKIKVIHNGVDHMLRFTPDRSAVDALGLGARPYVVALSNTQKHKNIRILFEAFADPRLADIDLVLVGSATAADFEALGMTPSRNVLFAGRINDPGLCALMQDAVALAFPSTTEGFGLPPLEAMILGCPAVVAPCGAIPEVCGDAVIYADPDSATDWAAAIEKLSHPDVRAEFARRGAAQAALFTWKNSALALKAELTALGLEI